MDYATAVFARGSIDAFNRGDMEALRDFYADDVLWHVAGKHGLSGDYRGRDELIAYFKRVLDLTGGSLKLESEAILASDQHTAIVKLFLRNLAAFQKKGTMVDRIV